MQKKGLIAFLLATMLTTGTAQGTDWGLWYGNGPNQPPRGEDTVEKLGQYGAYFMGNPKEKVLYLTFDCGYENGNTSKILDVLKKHHVPAAFFMVGDFLDTSPELVQRMAAEGHLVGNHTDKHPNMTKVAKQRFTQELKAVQTQYEQLTGQKLAPFYRPPEGSYTYQNLQWAQELGYHTTLWSVAYADWDTQKQPKQTDAIQTLQKRIHPGAIILLHSVSSTNAAILDTVLTNWKAQGYTFAYLTALPGIENTSVVAVPSQDTFRVQGQEVPITAYQIADKNYVKVRDLGMALRNSALAFGLEYDPTWDGIQVSKQEPYVPVGGELAGRAQVATMQAYPKNLRYNNQTVSGYLIQDTYYVPLREWILLLGGAVTYDAATNLVSITS